MASAANINARIDRLEAVNADIVQRSYHGIAARLDRLPAGKAHRKVLWLIGILRQPRHEHRRSHHRPAAGFGMVGQQPELHLRIDDGVRLSDRWIVGRHRIGQVRAQEGTRVLRIAVLGVLPGGDLCPEHDRPHRLPVLHAILPDTGRSANTLPRRSEGATRRGSGSSPTAERLSRRSCA